MSIWNVIYLIRFFFYLLYFTDFVYVSYRSQVLLYCLCDNVDFLFYFFIIVHIFCLVYCKKSYINVYFLFYGKQSKKKKTGKK